jgi:cobalamin biosynthesis protein CobC
MMARDHGGDLDRARGLWGGDDWIDLSTGINRLPWPYPAPQPPLPAAAWGDLPTASARAMAEDAACALWGANAALAVNGAQAAIEAIPHLWTPGRAAVLAHSYNEHAAQLRAAGWQVDEVADPAGMAGADLAVIVNPNNPDGRIWSPAQVMALAQTVGRLVVDESFGDCDPALSVAARAGERLIVLRSFGKFWGLAGVRLGFVLADPATLGRLAARMGLWAVSGPALALGAMALPDRDWADETRARLLRDAVRLDGLAAVAGWRPVGGTGLFRTYETTDAEVAQARLARARIWSRIFPYSARWLRLGLPGGEAEWDRLTRALSQG